MRPYRPLAAGVLIAALLTMSTPATAANANCCEEQEPDKELEPAEEETVLRHVVLFGFKEGTTDDKVKEIEEAFAALPSKIDVIVDFEWGRDVGVEGLDQGHTHCFFVTFKDEAGRATYLPHPAHKEFVTLVKPHLENVTVIDYKTPK